MKNITANDAYMRILKARTGSLANPVSEEYLRRLQSELADWAGDIQMMLDGMRQEKINLLPRKIG